MKKKERNEEIYELKTKVTLLEEVPTLEKTENIINRSTTYLKKKK
ncbi:hypothetical protein [Anaerobacillus alkalidiazotrophicus]|nr:hypothetical protein [Anaerobacillus alkalidiazotrophicus]